MSIPEMSAAEEDGAVGLAEHMEMNNGALASPATYVPDSLEDNYELESPRDRADRRRWVYATVLMTVALLAGGVGIGLALHFTRNDPPLRLTSVGEVQGRAVPPGGGVAGVDEFLGIPYAAPPLGNRQFEKPEPLESLPETPFPADRMRYSCLQPLEWRYNSFEGVTKWNAPHLSEDCLFLNIWAPEGAVGQKKAVMVWIHGGWFHSGSNALPAYNGRVLAAYGDVIVVSINYRLGVFGFLNTGDGKINGNLGLWDQMLALQWVRREVAVFGGDPERITLFGSDAGAASISLLLNSPAGGDFRRAIIQSGAPASRWAFMTKEDAVQRSDKLLARINCPKTLSLQQLKTCIRKVSPLDLLAKARVVGRFEEFLWVPSVDGELIRDNSITSISAVINQQTQNLKDKDILLGVNSHDGVLALLNDLPSFLRDFVNQSSQTEDQFLNAISNIGWDVPENLLTQVLIQYDPTNRVKPGTPLGTRFRDALISMVTDRSYKCPMAALADEYAAMATRVYVYELQYRAYFDPWPSWTGAMDRSEIQWVFGAPLQRNNTVQYSKEEYLFSKVVMSYWTNFAKYGAPNAGYRGSALTHWPGYGVRERGYQRLGVYTALPPGPLPPLTPLPQRPRNTTYQTALCRGLWATVRHTINSRG